MKLGLVFLCVRIFAMDQDLFAMDQKAFMRKCEKENVVRPKNTNKGEFYRARKNGKLIYFLGTYHPIGSSGFANGVLKKVKNQLDADFVSSIDKLWAESPDYIAPESPCLDSYYFEGLESIAKENGPLDVFTWKLLRLRNNSEAQKPANEQTWEGKTKNLQSFMRGYPLQMWGDYTSELMEQKQDEEMFWRNKQWVQKLLNEKRVQFVVAGAAHNWFKTGVLKLLEQKGWEITQSDLNLRRDTTVTLEQMSLWEEQMYEDKTELRKMMSWARMVGDLLRDSPLFPLALFVAHVVAIRLLRGSMVQLVITSAAILIVAFYLLFVTIEIYINSAKFKTLRINFKSSWIILRSSFGSLILLGKIVARLAYHNVRDNPLPLLLLYAAHVTAIIFFQEFIVKLVSFSICMSYVALCWLMFKILS